MPCGTALVMRCRVWAAGLEGSRGEVGEAGWEELVRGERMEKWVKTAGRG